MQRYEKLYEQDDARCVECGASLGAPLGTNGIGRPVRECANGHRQSGPFPYVGDDDG